MALAAVAAAFMPDVRDQPTHDSLEDAQNASLAMVPGGPATPRTAPSIAGHQLEQNSPAV
jgi:hypothetical protein